MSWAFGTNFSFENYFYLKFRTTMEKCGQNCLFPLFLMHLRYVTYVRRNEQWLHHEISFPIFKWHCLCTNYDFEMPFKMCAPCLTLLWYVSVQRDTELSQTIGLILSWIRSIFMNFSFLQFFGAYFLCCIQIKE